MIKPTQNKILIKKIENKTRGSILLPDTVEVGSMEGEVIELGMGELVDGKRYTFSVKVGDKVLFGKWSGTEIKYNDETFYLIVEDDLIGIIN